MNRGENVETVAFPVAGQAEWNQIVGKQTAQIRAGCAQIGQANRRVDHTERCIADRSYGWPAPENATSASRRPEGQQ